MKTGIDKNKSKLGSKNLNMIFMLNTLPQVKNAEQTITNTKNSMT